MTEICVEELQGAPVCQQPLETAPESGIRLASQQRSVADELAGITTFIGDLADGRYGIYY